MLLLQASFKKEQKLNSICNYGFLIWTNLCTIFMLSKIFNKSCQEQHKFSLKKRTVNKALC